VKFTTHFSEDYFLLSSKNDIAAKVEIISDNPQIAVMKMFCSKLAIGRIMGAPR